MGAYAPEFKNYCSKIISFCLLLGAHLPECLEITSVFRGYILDIFGCIYSGLYIHLAYREGNQEKTLCLRKVRYRDEKGRMYDFITNNFEVSREEVAFLYKLRWNIELLFKKLKQNFQLHYFYSETENGIKTQIWSTLIAQLLLQVLRVRSESKKAFSTMAALIRIHLISYLELFWMVENSRRTYVKIHKKKKPPAIQTELF